MRESTGANVGMCAAPNSEPGKAESPVDKDAETTQSSSNSTQHGLTPDLQADVNQVPLYVLFKRVQRADGSICALEITYATFYAFNGPYSIGCCQPFCFEAGAHDGDWEHFTVRCGPC